MTASIWSAFSDELDAAMQSHLEWTRRVLRCAVLHTAPGSDVLEANAHELCRFGRWFAQNRTFFDALDAQKARALDINHHTMHDTIRDICGKVMAGEPGSEASLSAFETTQTLLIEYLGHFKTLVTQIDSQIDPLTGLALRHRLEQNFELLKKRCSRQGCSAAIMIIDIDHFKSVNDRHGHIGGDIVLKEIATRLKASIRENDEAYRYGGDELLVLLELLTAEEAETAAQRVLSTIRAQSIRFSDGNVAHSTVTIGIALVQGNESIDNVLHRADTALYQGKAQGRNCYVVATNDASEP